jgi:hypothetical protein
MDGREMASWGVFVSFGGVSNTPHFTLYNNFFGDRSEGGQRVIAFHAALHWEGSEPIAGAFRGAVFLFLFLFSGCVQLPCILRSLNCALCYCLSSSKQDNLI